MNYLLVWLFYAMAFSIPVFTLLWGIEQFAFLAFQLFSVGKVITKFSVPFVLMHDKIEIGKVIKVPHGKFVFISEDVCLFRYRYLWWRRGFLKGRIKFEGRRATIEGRLFLIDLLIWIVYGIGFMALVVITAIQSGNFTLLVALIIITAISIFLARNGLIHVKNEFVTVYHEIRQSLKGDAELKPTLHMD